jgi:spectinomycin phosphotransferase
MTTKQLERRIIESLKIYYGIEVALLTPLLLGADLNACMYKAQADDQGSYFVKIKKERTHTIGVSITDLLYEEGIEQMIAPIKSLNGHSIEQMDDFTIIVYPFIEGQNGFSQALTTKQWFALGKALSKIHQIKVPEELSIRKETYSAKWRDYVRSLYDHLEVTPSGDALAVKLLTFMKEHKDEIYLLVERAELLSQQIQKKHVKFVLCHSDIHAGNVLISGNELIYIVDWDETIMAPKERDLMFIGGGVANVWNKPEEEEYFYKGYGKTEIDLSILAYYRHERIVEDIAIYAQALISAAADKVSRSEMYHHFLSMFAPQGVVEIALKTGNDLKI